MVIELKSTHEITPHPQVGLEEHTVTTTYEHPKTQAEFMCALAWIQPIGAPDSLTGLLEIEAINRARLIIKDKVKLEDAFALPLHYRAAYDMPNGEWLTD